MRFVFSTTKSTEAKNFGLTATEFADLLRRLQEQSDEKLLEIILEQHHSACESLLMRQYKATAQEADEAIIAALYKIWGRLNANKLGYDNLSSLFKTMCVQKFIDFRNKEKQNRLFLHDPEESLASQIQDDTDDVLAVLEKEEKNQFFKKALAQLGQRCQQLLTAFYIDGKSDKEIAAETGRSEGAINVARYDCRKKLKTYFISQDLSCYF